MPRDRRSHRPQARLDARYDRLKQSRHIAPLETVIDALTGVEFAVETP